MYSNVGGTRNYRPRWLDWVAAVCTGRAIKVRTKERGLITSTPRASKRPGCQPVVPGLLYRCWPIGGQNQRLLAYHESGHADAVFLAVVITLGVQRVVESPADQFGQLLLLLLVVQVHRRGLAQIVKTCPVKLT